MRDAAEETAAESVRTIYRTLRDGAIDVNGTLAAAAQNTSPLVDPVKSAASAVRLSGGASDEPVPYLSQPVLQLQHLADHISGAKPDGALFGMKNDAVRRMYRPVFAALEEVNPAASVTSVGTSEDAVTSIRAFAKQVSHVVCHLFGVPVPVSFVPWDSTVASSVRAAFAVSSGDTADAIAAAVGTSPAFKLSIVDVMSDESRKQKLAEAWGYAVASTFVASFIGAGAFHNADGKLGRNALLPTSVCEILRASLVEMSTALQKLVAFESGWISSAPKPFVNSVSASRMRLFVLYSGRLSDDHTMYVTECRTAVNRFAKMLALLGRLNVELRDTFLSNTLSSVLNVGPLVDDKMFPCGDVVVAHTYGSFTDTEKNVLANSLEAFGELMLKDATYTPFLPSDVAQWDSGRVKTLRDAVSAPADADMKYAEWFGGWRPKVTIAEEAPKSALADAVRVFVAAQHIPTSDVFQTEVLISYLSLRMPDWSTFGSADRKIPDFGVKFKEPLTDEEVTALNGLDDAVKRQLRKAILGVENTEPFEEDTINKNLPLWNRRKAAFPSNSADPLLDAYALWHQFHERWAETEVHSVQALLAAQIARSLIPNVTPTVAGLSWHMVLAVACINLDVAGVLAALESVSTAAPKSFMAEQGLGPLPMSRSFPTPTRDWRPLVPDGSVNSLASELLIGRILHADLTIRGNMSDDTRRNMMSAILPSEGTPIEQPLLLPFSDVPDSSLATDRALMTLAGRALGIFEWEKSHDAACLLLSNTLRSLQTAALASLDGHTDTKANIADMYIRSMTTQLQDVLKALLTNDFPASAASIVTADLKWFVGDPSKTLTILTLDPAAPVLGFSPFPALRNKIGAAFMPQSLASAAEAAFKHVKDSASAESARIPTLWVDIAAVLPYMDREESGWREMIELATCARTGKCASMEPSMVNPSLLTSPVPVQIFEVPAELTSMPSQLSTVNKRINKLITKAQKDDDGGEAIRDATKLPPLLYVASAAQCKVVTSWSGDYAGCGSIKGHISWRFPLSLTNLYNAEGVQDDERSDLEDLARIAGKP